MTAIFCENYRHYSNLFLYWKAVYFDSNFIEIWSHGSDEQHANIGLDNGLAPIQR